MYRSFVGQKSPAHDKLPRRCMTSSTVRPTGYWLNWGIRLNGIETGTNASPCLTDPKSCEIIHVPILGSISFSLVWTRDEQTLHGADDEISAVDQQAASNVCSVKTKQRTRLRYRAKKASVNSLWSGRILNWLSIRKPRICYRLSVVILELEGSRFTTWEWPMKVCWTTSKVFAEFCCAIELFVTSLSSMTEWRSK